MNTETVSVKPTRGRPQTLVRISYDEVCKRIGSPRGGCHRTEMNAAYARKTLIAASKLSGEEQTILWGGTFKQIRNGDVNFPRGWVTAANEIGRYFIAFVDEDEDRLMLMQSVAKARRDGSQWRDIGSHYRSLRLGERTGNDLALVCALCRTLDEYKLKFPATSEATITGAVKGFLQIVEGGDDE